jgi:hypothetical protein
MIAELPSHRGDVGQAGRVVQPVTLDVAQRPLSRLAAQIRDGFEAESYDGLTPVTMTL